MYQFFHLAGYLEKKTMGNDDRDIEDGGHGGDDDKAAPAKENFRAPVTIKVAWASSGTKASLSC